MAICHRNCSCVCCMIVRFCRNGKRYHLSFQLHLHSEHTSRNTIHALRIVLNLSRRQSNKLHVSMSLNVCLASNAKHWYTCMATSTADTFNSISQRVHNVCCMNQFKENASLNGITECQLVFFYTTGTESLAFSE